MNTDWDDWTEDTFDEKPPTENNKDPPSEARNRYRNAYAGYNSGYGPQGGFNMPKRPPGGPRGRFDGAWGGPSFGPPGPPPFGPPDEHPSMYVRRNQMMGRNFNPGPLMMQRRNNMAERTIKYLIRCGMVQQNLKNLPWQFLQLIEPQRCNVCAMDFDSFTLSRIHYSSKNHLKKQKKWMTQYSTEGYKNTNKEAIPMRARELYCELCDVQITSKAHAEAHYAGKPHRAVVEGRKSAKNPFLNQPGMEGRLEQLIRREKKHLKAEPAAEKADAAPPSQPELYCAICSTTVTCSEQMMTHLNGKKHLAKEKSHILKVMRAGNATSNGKGAGDDDKKSQEHADSAPSAEGLSAQQEDVAAQQEDAIAQQEDAIAQQEDAIAQQEDAIAQQEDETAAAAAEWIAGGGAAWEEPTDVSNN